MSAFDLCVCTTSVTVLLLTPATLMWPCCVSDVHRKVTGISSAPTQVTCVVMTSSLTWPVARNRTPPYVDVIDQLLRAGSVTKPVAVLLDEVYDARYRILVEILYTYQTDWVGSPGQRPTGRVGQEPGLNFKL